MLVNEYDDGLYCANGHPINLSARTHPEHSSEHCKICGAPAITKCESCATRIRGIYHYGRNVAIVDTPPVPECCHNCGEPYPWAKGKTARILRAVLRGIVWPWRPAALGLEIVLKALALIGEATAGGYAVYWLITQFVNG